MQKIIIFLFVAIIGTVLVSCENTDNGKDEVESASEESREFYQLKIYSFNSEDQVKATDNYLKDSYLPALKEQGINDVGVFKLRTEKEDTIQKTYVLVPFSDLDQFINLEANLSKSENYLSTGKEYINASHDKPPYHRIESILLRAFSDMPIMQASKLDGPRSERIYELRSYESSTEKYYKNKVDMFNEGGEIKLFDRLEFNAVFYAEVISGGKMPNLMYMTTFSDQQSRDEHWKAFGEAPEWKELIAMKKYENNMSHIDIFSLYPTAYSDY